MPQLENRLMRSRYLWGGAATLLLTTAATPALADGCSQLASRFHRPNTTITIAQTISTGSFSIPGNPGQTITGLPKFCRIAGVATPTSDSQIGFEVWIPEYIWNAKFLQAGCGGFCGSISYGAMAEPLRRGYAVAATDDGHQANGGDASWAVGHPQKVIDFGFRAIKETTDVAKAIIASLKLSGPRRSYFMGCSDGGREALMEAQRFPEDFDGIAAGAPANNWSHLFTGFLWNVRALAATNSGDLSKSDINTLSQAGLAQCVGKDGGLSTDTFLNNPPVCHFNPKKLLCGAGNAASCLSSDKVEAIEKIISGPPGIFPGYGPGADANVSWPTWILGPGDPARGVQGLDALTYFQNMVFPNSGWTLNSFSIDENAKNADLRTGKSLDSIDPNLRAFKSRGGKLIQYFGWADAAISPWNSINYYESVEDEMGPKTINGFYRLFPVPGMDHCILGPGANSFGQAPFAGPTIGPNPSSPADDILSALDHWVEYGNAPEQIIATKYVNDDATQGIAFQRPLCPYPKFARYKGKGDTKAATSFECVRGDEDSKHAANQ